MGSSEIRVLARLTPHDVEELADILVDCVEGGASVSFMLPITRERARAFWSSAAASLERGERIVIVAHDAQGYAGTVQILLDQPENQPHRGDLAKMLVRRRARGQGLGAALLRAAESQALRAGKALLVLDTANPDAERLYERGGWQACGVIPNYALMPDGTYAATRLYCKQLAPLPAWQPGP
ncbi:GNAT family N-acetyltransferase [Ramlibacter sp.]|uniref:GNAT family N-acetyltransferase n=1 Tax=Ramlibacter sp. TaxID=1917967 RepID=UPI002601C940|nr:GNAT family N-acetyltransferase [Ramlibacter sp.]MDB5957372.1 GCN5-related N-acetyltransferase [Ramlibacter sp.]